MLRFPSLSCLFSSVDENTVPAPPNIHFEVKDDIPTPPKPTEDEPKTLNFFDFYGKMMAGNMLLFTAMTSLASPFERARTIVQADLASLSSVQQFDAARGPITPGVLAERPIYSSSATSHLNQIYNRTVVAEPAKRVPLFPSAYEVYYNSIAASQKTGKKAPVVVEPRWTSMRQVLRRVYNIDGVKGLFRGNGVLQMANFSTQMTGCNLLMPLVLMQIFGRKVSDNPEHSMLASHLAAHLHLYLGMYPIFSTLTRFYADKNLLYPALPRDHPRVREFISMMATNEVDAAANSTLLRLRSRLRSKLSPEAKFFQKPVTRVIERWTVHDGRKGLFRGKFIIRC